MKRADVRIGGIYLAEVKGDAAPPRTKVRSSRRVKILWNMAWAYTVGVNLGTVPFGLSPSGLLFVWGVLGVFCPGGHPGTPCLKRREPRRLRFSGC